MGHTMPEPTKAKAQVTMADQSTESSSGTEAACFYASGAPVANAIGAELGVVTRDKDSGAVQRTGIGFYVRSDHLCNNTYFGNVPVA